MSRNLLCLLLLICYPLEKPVLFDVTERIDWHVRFYNSQLEKPVLFDVTEQFQVIQQILMY